MCICVGWGVELEFYLYFILFTCLCTSVFDLFAMAPKYPPSEVAWQSKKRNEVTPFARIRGEVLVGVAYRETDSYIIMLTSYTHPNFVLLFNLI